MAYTLPFGKFAGRAVSTVPTSYLRWMLATCDVGAGLEAALRRELSARGEKYVPAPEVFDDLEECLTTAVSEDPNIDADVAGVLTDHVMLAFQVIRDKYGVTEATELVIAGRPVAGNWRNEDDHA